MSKEVQEHIVETAQKLFYRYGIRSVTMDYIASELGMSKRTLYENFENKEALVIASLEKIRQSQEATMCAIFNSDANTIEKLVRCYSNIISHLNKISRSFMLDIEQMHSRASEEVKISREKQFSYIRNIFAKGIEEDLIRKDIDINIATMLHNSQMEWFHKMQLTSEDGWRKGEILSTLVQIFLCGIVTEKGRRVFEENKELIMQIL